MPFAVCSQSPPVQLVSTIKKVRPQWPHLYYLVHVVSCDVVFDSVLGCQLISFSLVVAMCQVSAFSLAIPLTDIISAIPATAHYYRGLEHDLDTVVRTTSLEQAASEPLTLVDLGSHLGEQLAPLGSTILGIDELTTTTPLA